MKSASYTRGVPVASSQPFDPLFRNAPAAVTAASPTLTRQDSPLTHQSSLGLNQYRRHCASMTAGIPLRTPSYAPSDDGRPSWPNDSPKKARAYLSKERTGVIGNLWGKIEESKLFNQRFIKNNKKECLGWLTLFCLIIVGYKFFSDGSFSAILTLSSAFQCFSMVVLNLKVVSQQSVAGVSQRSVLLIVVCLSSRLVSTLFYNGYLPVDRSGDWLYQGADLMSVLLGGGLLIYAGKYCSTTIQSQKDKDTCVVVVPVIIAALLAMAIHPTLNQNMLADVAWTFALYVETFAMVPQLFMMGKVGGEVEALTSHYVASMAASKIFTFLFWYFSFTELAPRRGGRNIAGWAVILSYSAQTLLFADFFYYYIKSIRIGRKMIINF